MRREGTLKRTVQIIAVAALLLAACPSYADQGPQAPPAATEEERALEEAAEGVDLFPIGGTVSLTQAIGGGTFVSDPYVRRAAVDLTLSAAPYWRITPLMRLTLTAAVSTSLVENYDSITTYRNRTLLSDTALSFAHLSVYKIPVVDINIDASVALSFPTSPQSRFRDLYVSSRAKLGFSRSIGPVYISYRFFFFKNFNEYTSPTVDTSDVGEHVVLAHFEGNEQLTSDLISVGGNNVSFGIINALLVSWNITSELALAVYYELNNSWTYNSFPNDELSSEYAQGGRGQRDVQRGIVDVGYQFTDYLNVSLGVETLVAPKSLDNESFIFPFMNFSNNYRNNTSVYLSLTGIF